MATESLVDDDGLMRAAQKGDRGAFIVLARAHQKSVYRVAYAVLRDRDPARKVAIDALLRAWRGIGQAPDAMSFPVWITRITLQLALAQRRARARTPAPAFAEGGLPGAHPAALERCEAAYDALTPEHQQAISLRLVANLGYSDLARVLDVPIAVAVTRVSGARANMLSRLGGPEMLE